MPLVAITQLLPCHGTWAYYLELKHYWRLGGSLLDNSCQEVQLYFSPSDFFPLVNITILIIIIDPLLGDARLRSSQSRNFARRATGLPGPPRYVE